MNCEKKELVHIGGNTGLTAGVQIFWDQPDGGMEPILSTPTRDALAV